MTGQFIVAIEHLECFGNLGGGMELSNGLRLISNAEKVECLKDNRFARSAGTLELEALKRCKLFAVTKIREFDLDGQTQILHLLDRVNNFLSLLWLSIEHTAFFDRGYLFETNGNLHLNTQLGATYDWKGERKLVKVTVAALNDTKLVLRKFSGEVGDDFKVNDNRLILGSGKTTVANIGVELFGRFLMFGHFARQTNDPALRIAFICSGLEVLFSTGSTELTHRVSERVAFLMETDPKKRIHLYSVVKKLYGIRSSFLHGDSIKKSEEPHLLQRVREADSLLRRVSLELYTNTGFFEAVTNGKDTLEEFHTKLLFRD